MGFSPRHSIRRSLRMACDRGLAANVSVHALEAAIIHGARIPRSLRGGERYRQARRSAGEKLRAELDAKMAELAAGVMGLMMLNRGAAIGHL